MSLAFHDHMTRGFLTRSWSLGKPWHAIYQIRGTTPCRGQPVSPQKGLRKIHLAGPWALVIWKRLKQPFMSPEAGLWRPWQRGRCRRPPVSTIIMELFWLNIASPSPKPQRTFRRNSCCLPPGPLPRCVRHRHLPDPQHDPLPRSTGKPSEGPAEDSSGRPLGFGHLEAPDPRL